MSYAAMALKMAWPYLSMSQMTVRIANASCDGGRGESDRLTKVRGKATRYDQSKRKVSDDDWTKSRRSKKEYTLLGHAMIGTRISRSSQRIGCKR